MKTELSFEWNDKFGDVENITAVHKWSDDKAVHVHEYAKHPRPWIDVTLAENDILGALKEEYDGTPSRLGEAFRSVNTDLGDAFRETIDNYDWGIPSDNEKRFRKKTPTWRYISDSYDLSNSYALHFQ